LRVDVRFPTPDFLAFFKANQWDVCS
jgi:hypothetical protein